jgi:folate-binding protein YgfZ
VRPCGARDAAAIEAAALALAESTSEGAFGTGANSARIAPIRPHETPAKTKMSKPHAVDLSASSEALTVLAFRGIDAARFLQGQLSADIEKLVPGQSTLAGLHNPQGRVLALLALVRSAAEELLAVLPRELAAPVTQHLRKYVLRSKLKIETPGDSLRVLGVESALPGFTSIAWGTRQLLLVGGERAAEFPASDAAALIRWQLADLREGLPQVYTATSEAFVAQMLNLDLLGAIAFDKGCYTGQEVIARAHYRGRVKRRLQRWRARSGTLPLPGDSVQAADGRALTVVRAVSDDRGEIELLAVGPFAGSGAGEATEAVQAPAGEKLLVEGPLPLPYALPD